MDIDLIFKVAAVGLMVAILNQVLAKAGREDQALITTLVGLVTVLIVLVSKLVQLFAQIRQVFGL
jgi:stage III sporulation protein AC